MHTKPKSDLMGRVLCVTLFLALYLASFAFPVFHLANGKITSSIVVFLVGWSAILGWQFAWIANPMALATVVFFLRGSFRKALWLALLTAAASLNTFTMMGEAIVLDAGGSSAKVTHLGGGAYLWLASMLMLFICCAIYVWRERELSRRIS